MKKPNKKHLFSLILITFLLSMTVESFAQQNKFKESENTSYSIQNKTTLTNSAMYVNAVNAANLNHHRLRSKRNVITFEGGASISLFSAEELVANGITNLNPSDFPIQFNDYTSPLFKLGENNHVLEEKKIIIPKESFSKH